MAGGARVGAGGTGAPRSRCRRPPFNDFPERRPVARPRPLIGRPWFVALLLRRCPPLIGGALAAGVREQVSLPAPGG